MATYTELYDLRTDSALRNRVAVACVVAAETVRLESPSVENHANRLAWAARTVGRTIPRPRRRDTEKGNSHARRSTIAPAKGTDISSITALGIAGATDLGALVRQTRIRQARNEGRLTMEVDVLEPEAYS